MSDMKNFEYNGQTIYYFVKDITFKETRGKEMASGYMIVCDENSNQTGVFALYDERTKVIYALPNDAKRWYDDYLNKR